MARKNTLTAADAQQVEEAFRAKLMTLTAPVEDHPADEDTKSPTAETSTGSIANLHPHAMGSTKAYLVCPNLDAFAIGSTSAQ